MTTLVTGARGKIARRVVAELHAAGEPVTAASREPGAAELPVGVTAVHLDAEQPESWAAALRGVRRVFLYSDPLGVAGFVNAALAAGVERVVVLSSLAAEGADATEPVDGRPLLTAQSDPMAWRHVVVERAIAESGIPWTFVRPGMFATNSLRWAPGVRANGVVRAAFPRAEAAPIHERDIADVAVRALLDGGHEHARYALTGPGSLTQQRQVELIGEAIGQPVRFVELGVDEATAELARWAPPEIATRLMGVLAATDGRPARVLDTVEKVTGHPGRSFAEWALDHADAFR